MKLQVVQLTAYKGCELKVAGSNPTSFFLFSPSSVPIHVLSSLNTHVQSYMYIHSYSVAQPYSVWIWMRERRLSCEIGQC